MKPIRIFLILMVILSVEVCSFAQVAERQTRQERRINRLLNKRYGSDSLRYQLRFVEKNERITLYNPENLKDTMLGLKKRIDSLAGLLSMDQRKIIFYKDSLQLKQEIEEGLRYKYDILQKEFSRLRVSRDSLFKRILITNEQDSITIKLVQDKLTLASATYSSSETIATGLRNTINNLLQTIHLDSTKIKVLIDKLKKMDSNETQNQKHLVASITKLKSNYDEKANQLEWQQQLSARYSLALLLSVIGLSVLACLQWILPFFNKAKRQYLPCLVLDIQKDVMFADVYHKNTNTTELRKFDATPLKNILTFDETAINETFELAIVKGKNSKAFFYRKGHDNNKILFDNLYDDYQKDNNEETEITK